MTLSRSDYSKDRAAYRKEHGQCVRCGRDARPGKAMCAECAAHVNAYQNTRNINARRGHVKGSQKDIVRAWITNYRSTLICMKCGESDPICIDLHHRNPLRKQFNLAQGHKYTLEEVKDEIAKCDPLCKNCHAKQHRDDRQERLRLGLSTRIRRPYKAN